MKKRLSVLLLSMALAGCGGGDDTAPPDYATIGTGADKQVVPSADAPDPLTWPPTRPVPGGASYTVVFEVSGQPPFDIVMGQPVIGLNRAYWTRNYSTSFLATQGQSLYLSAASLERGAHSLGGAKVTIYADGKVISTTQAQGNTQTATIEAICC